MFNKQKFKIFLFIICFIKNFLSYSEEKTDTKIISDELDSINPKIELNIFNENNKRQSIFLKDTYQVLDRVKMAQPKTTKEKKEEIKKEEKIVNSFSKSVDRMNEEVNKGLSLMAAMSSLDFGEIESPNDIVVATSVGNYADSQSVAVGVAMAPNDRLGFSVRYSVSTDDVDTSAIGLGAKYRFTIGE